MERAVLRLNSFFLYRTNNVVKFFKIPLLLKGNQYLSMRITYEQIRELVLRNNLEFAVLKAFISVESNGSGFAKDTGKIVIQFEPHYFKKSKEWIVFNNAFVMLIQQWNLLYWNATNYGFSLEETRI